MVTKKLVAIWRIITSNKSLVGQMHLLVAMQMFTEDIQVKLAKDATEQGQLKTLQALRALVIEKLEK